MLYAEHVHVKCMHTHTATTQSILELANFFNNKKYKKDTYTCIDIVRIRTDKNKK